jgi:hypothetical protein
MSNAIDEATVAATPDGIMQLGLGFWGAKTLLSAVELGLFTELARRPATAEALQTRLELHPRSARDFLDALVALGMLERQDELYRNTAATDLYLDRAKPSYIGGLLEMANARLYGFWGGLTEALCTGRPQNEAKHGGDFFAALYADPARLEGFLKAMTGLSAPIAAAIARQFPWDHHHTLIDIGTAQGGLPVTIASTHPHLTGGGFDLPMVEPIFARHVAAHGLADRLRFHPGDFLRDPLPSADVLVMGHILHDWDLDEKRAILAKAHAALPPGGALIVYDMMIDDERRRNAAGLLMSLNMLIETPGGFDNTGADCVGWLREAGFREPRVEPLGGAYSMAVGIR